MMQSCLVLQQTAVESPPFDIARNAAEHIRGLGQRLGAGDSSFDAVLDALLQAGLASWIVDYVAVVCADSSVTSDDPEEAFLLSGEAVAAWCCRSTEGLQRQLHALITGEQGPGAVAEEAEISRIAAGAESLLRVARGLRAAVAWSGSSRSDLNNLPQRLQLLQQATQALIYCRSSGVHPRAPPPDHASRTVWQRAVSGRRSQHPGGRLFLDDLLDAAQQFQQQQAQQQQRGGSRAGAGYPWTTPAAAVDALFGEEQANGSGSSDLMGSCSTAAAPQAEAARRSRLALLFYYLTDGGWCAQEEFTTHTAEGASGGGGVTAAGFAHAFGLPPGLVAQWEAQQLLDRAGGRSGGGPHLARACDLLLGCANARTPFRVVEALVAAGRPAQALSVQRARGAASAAGGLHEQRVLLAARLQCGLLHEAHACIRLHCSQLPPRDRSSHLEALMGQLLDWAGAEDDARRQRAGDGGGDDSSAGHAPSASRLQQVAQLPLGPEEEAVMRAWLEARAVKGQPDGELLPLYLLQRGRSLEALAAYSHWKDSPAAASSTPSHRTAQLALLMSSAAAALPPCLRANMQTLLALGARGSEPPAFLAPVVPPGDPAAAEEAAAALVGGAAAAVEGGLDDGLTAVGDAAGVQQEGTRVGQEGSLFGMGVDGEGLPNGGGVRFASAGTAEAGGGVGVGIGGLATGAGPLPTGGLLFAVPPPQGGSLFGAPAAAPAAAGGMSEAEFRQQLLGMGAAGGGGGAKPRPATRTSKRQRH